MTLNCLDHKVSRRRIPFVLIIHNAEPDQSTKNMFFSCDGVSLVCSIMEEFKVILRSLQVPVPHFKESFDEPRIVCESQVLFSLVDIVQNPRNIRLLCALVVSSAYPTERLCGQCVVNFSHGFVKIGSFAVV